MEGFSRSECNVISIYDDAMSQTTREEEIMNAKISKANSVELNTTLVALILSAAAALISTNGSAAPGGVTLNSVTAGGSGCPQGSVRGFVDTASSKLILSFKDLIAEAGHGLPISEQRKNCTISVDLQVPRGWSYALDSYAISGFVSLDHGVNARQRAETWFQGAGTRSITGTTSFFGSTHQSYRVTGSIPDSALVWSPCGVSRALNARISADVVARNGGSGLLTVDQASGAVTYSYGLRWKQCN